MYELKYRGNHTEEGNFFEAQFEDVRVIVPCVGPNDFEAQTIADRIGRMLEDGAE